MKAFSPPARWKFIFIAVCLAVYVLALWHFKTHRKAWFMFFGASAEYAEPVPEHRLRRGVSPAI